MTKDEGGSRPPIWAVLLVTALVLAVTGVLAVLGLDLAGIAGVLTAAGFVIGVAYRLFSLPPRRGRHREGGREPAEEEPVDPDPADPEPDAPPGNGDRGRERPAA